MTIASWTEERVEQLRSCVNAGLTCSQIADEIGMTRNAIIGKIHRLGLAQGRPATAVRLHRPRTPRPRPSLHELLRLAHKQDAPRRADTAPVELDPVESGKRRSLLELTDSACRWPLDDPGSAGFAFCGNEAIAGFSYCAGHARMAYRFPARRGA
jgi:GcrA cell cycle regulator